MSSSALLYADSICSPGFVAHFSSVRVRSRSMPQRHWRPLDACLAHDPVDRRRIGDSVQSKSGRL